MDPSPSLITDLLSPILPVLYSLHLHLESTKTSDPGTRESLHTSLLAWGRIVNTAEGVGVFDRILAGERGYWELDLEHGIRKVERSATLTLEGSILIHNPVQSKGISFASGPSHPSRFNGPRCDLQHPKPLSGPCSLCQSSGGD